ncbi:hypothetical protein B296_00047108 [Ensete ventricosum]|uniref:Uncharacterized protein n=1 Tax=Ensete ventricosum TaxID=4639 RepID=A0A426X718_ENSVE|nr:hypothetical protein B296_00047108 [Ensete ventricosum]
MRLRYIGFYSKGYEVSVHEILTASVAYHVIVLHHSLHGPYGEARDVLPATGERRSCPPYPCQVGRTTADPPMLVSGQLQSRRVNHVVGPAVRGRRDVTARSTFVISSPPREDLLETPNLGAEDEVM